jgi:hypothetical protein
MFNRKSVKWSFLIASVLILAACGEMGPSPYLSSSSASTSSSSSSSSSSTSSSSNDNSLINSSEDNSENIESTESIPSDVIQIKTRPDLININNNLSGNYLLVNNITLTGEWVPIGNGETPFTGTFDGNGFKIINLTISTARENVGFFSFNQGIIKNLTLDNVVINIQQMGSLDINVGSLVGTNDGFIEKINVTNQRGGIFFGESSASSANVGGIIGLNLTSGIFDQLNNEIVVVSEIQNSRTGGIVGSSIGTITIQSASNLSIVQGVRYIGGLIGRVEEGFTQIFNSSNEGSIVGNSIMGGLIGYGINVEIRNSFNGGDIISTSGAVGGLIGAGSGLISIKYSMNYGFVYGERRVGGLIGQPPLSRVMFYDHDLVINHSINFGDVQVSTISISPVLPLGGTIVGELAVMIRYDDEKAYFTKSIKNLSGKIINGINFGEGISQNSVSIDFMRDDLKWDTEIWDFTGLDVANGVYPILKNLPEMPVEE